MFKLPNGIPSINTDPQDWADFAEYKCILSKSIPLRDVVKEPKYFSDEIEINGIEDSEDSYVRILDDIATEIEHRISICNGLYPFELKDKGYNLVYKSNDSVANQVYIYLLLATRVNMKNARIHNHIDGAHLFETLSSSVIQNFFGKNSHVEIIGTSRDKDTLGFRKKLESITQKMGEGGRIKENAHSRPQDDGVDLIVWKDFFDKKRSKLIGFCQCKTGTSWNDSMPTGKAKNFMNSWFTDHPSVDPINIFFCSQYFCRNTWDHKANNVGLVFDRFRILDYLPTDNFDPILLKNLESWSNSVINYYRT